MCVTNENKRQYVHAVADYKLNRQVSHGFGLQHFIDFTGALFFFLYLNMQVLPFANAFYRGLIDLISPSWLSLFNANEFNQVKIPLNMLQSCFTFAKH